MKIILNTDPAYNVSSVQFLKEDPTEETPTVGNLFQSAAVFLSLVSESIAEQKNSTEDRKELYNSLILLVTDICEKVYPEYIDIKGSPEDFLAHLEKLSKECRNESI